MTLRKQQRLLAAATAPATPNHQLVCLVKAMIEARPMSPGELVKVIGEVQGALKLKPRTEPRKPTTAEILASIKPYGLMSFENGKTYTMLKRHLAHHGLTVAAYKEKWGLPDNYPIAAPAYSALRSKMAKAQGLGLNGQPKPWKSSSKTRAAAANKMGQQPHGSAPEHRFDAERRA